MLHITEQGGRSLRSHQSLPSPCYKRKRALQSTQVMGNKKHTSARNTVSSTLVNMVTDSIVPYKIQSVSRDVAPSQFRSVEQGVWRKNGRKPVNIELKCLTKTSEEDRVKFLQEAAIMAQFGHSNVILLHGVVIQGSPVRH